VEGENTICTVVAPVFHTAITFVTSLTVDEIKTPACEVATTDNA
jgi:hypothetical protein